jgi:SAM-dependent methyltransferase
MDKNWNSKEELDHFRAIWEYRSPGHKTMHTQQIWDERADEWENELTYDEIKIDSTRRRVNATVSYLRSRGLLRSTDDVIDIGCGPGRFVAEFAKTCRSATGSDISGRMLEHGAAFAQKNNLTNTDYIQADFNTADLDTLGWRKRFDLVFTSITPAVGGSENLNKLMEMSRGYCFNSCFVHAGDDLLDKFLQEELGAEQRNRVGSYWHWFYGLFNLLLLEGYFPEITYYDDCRNEQLPVTMETARRLCGKAFFLDGMNAEKLYEYMKRNANPDGTIARNSVCRYGWILWDVRRCVIR